MSCPFRHLWPGGPRAAVSEGDSAAAHQEPQSACPLTGKRQRQTPGAVAQPATSSDALPPPGVRGVRGSASDAGCSASSASQTTDIEPSTPSSKPGPTTAGQCPFLAGMGGIDLAAPQPASSSTSTQEGREGSLAAQQDEAAKAASAIPPAVCPLGFGSSQGPKLGQFHCMVCKSLFFDCVVTSCGHRYCAGCIRGAHDCPACGADITSLTPDPNTQALVERYIDAHAGTHTIWELEGPSSAAQQVDGLAGERSRASFLLQLGLRAIAAGNIDSARHRFQACQHELMQLLDDAAQQQQTSTEAASARAEVASLQCRLGAVIGCLGDCCRAEGDAAGTLAHYQHSVELLRAAGEDPEAQQALSVALNKVGELHHLQGQVQAAAELYGQALQLRRDLLAATQQQRQHKQHASVVCSRATEAAAEADSSVQRDTPHSGAAEAMVSEEAAAAAAAAAAACEECCCSATLDLAASCIKLAGARAELGGGEQAQGLLNEAMLLLMGLEAGLMAQPARLQRKHASLAGVAAAMAGQA